MQGIATAQEFFTSPRPQRQFVAVPQSAAARAYGGTQAVTTPAQKATLNAHKQAVSHFADSLHYHRAGLAVEAEYSSSHAVALLAMLKRTVNLESGKTSEELFRIYDYLLKRLEDEPLHCTETTEMAMESLSVPAHAWEQQMRQNNVVHLMQQRANRMPY